MTRVQGSFSFHETPIDGVWIVEPTVHGDQRGFLVETFKQCDFDAAGLSYRFVQENHSHSRRGVLRGLHFQKEHPQAKLVRVLAGEVFDVAVDLREGSPTYGKSVHATLSSENHAQLLIPRGFAHGFLVVSEQAYIGYLCDNYYDPADEGGIAYYDPDLDIPWPALEPILSEKDKLNPTLADRPIAFCIENGD